MAKQKAKAISTQIRFPRDMKDWIEEKAALHYGSQNSVVLSCVKAKMDAECKSSKSSKNAAS